MACHLNLIQWATEPIWEGITDPAIRQGHRCAIRYSPRISYLPASWKFPEQRTL